MALHHGIDLFRWVLLIDVGLTSCSLHLFIADSHELLLVHKNDFTTLALAHIEKTTFFTGRLLWALPCKLISNHPSLTHTQSHGGETTARQTIGAFLAVIAPRML